MELSVIDRAVLIETLSPADKTELIALLLRLGAAPDEVIYNFLIGSGHPVDQFAEGDGIGVDAEGNLRCDQRYDDANICARCFR